VRPRVFLKALKKEEGMTYHHQKETPNKSVVINKSTIAYKGYDVFYTEPSVSDEIECKACGATCGVKRRITGPTGHLSAMSDNHTLHDSFHCPNIGKDWHDKAVKLVMAIEDTPSKSIATIMNKDLQDTLQHKSN
jgi:hypothetical protein